MGKFLFQRREVAAIAVQVGAIGNRAVFMIEVEGRRERRQVKELFTTVAELAEVAPLSEGPLVAYAVQVHGDPSLFAKIEWLVKSQFSFSVVERSFTATTYRLLESLCEDSESRLLPVERCGICDAPDPFPTRITLRDEANQPVLEAAYCSGCAAQQTNRDPRKTLVALLAADRRDLAAVRQARLVRSRQPSLAASDGREQEVQVYAVAS